MVEDLKVEVYDSVITLKEVAAITTPEPRQILVSPWDKTVLKEIEKALRADGFSPVVDEDFLRVVLPPLTGEVREELMRKVGEQAEEARVSVRIARRKAIEKVDKAKKNKEISEDEEFVQKKKINELVERYNNRIDEISREKSEQLSIG